MFGEALTNASELCACNRYLAVHKLHKHGIYQGLDMGELGEILADADFHAIPENRVSIF